MEEKTRRKKKQRINGWKIAFLSLVAMILALMTVLCIRIFNVPEEAKLQPVKISSEITELAEVTSTKEKLNQIIQKSVNETDLKKNDFAFRLDKKVELSGTYTLFGVELPLLMSLTPTTLEDGNVELKIASMSVGTLGLPKSEVLKGIQSVAKFPNYVEIKPEQEKIIIRLDKIKLGGNLHVKAKMVDLVNDKFVFTIYSK